MNRYIYIYLSIYLINMGKFFHDVIPVDVKSPCHTLRPGATPRSAASWRRPTLLPAFRWLSK